MHNIHMHPVLAFLVMGILKGGLDLPNRGIRPGFGSHAGKGERGSSQRRQSRVNCSHSLRPPHPTHRKMLLCRRRHADGWLLPLARPPPPCEVWQECPSPMGLFLPRRPGMPIVSYKEAASCPYPEESIFRPIAPESRSESLLCRLYGSLGVHDAPCPAGQANTMKAWLAPQTFRDTALLGR
jgi:hypothetical protein